MSATLTTAYKRLIVLTFGGAAAGLLLFLIYMNATTAYELSAFEFSILAQIIIATLAIDLFAQKRELNGDSEGGK